MTKHAYSAFGVTVRCNRPLPLLPVARAEVRRTLEVHIAEGPVADVSVGSGAADYAAGYERLWRLDDGGWLLRYDDWANGRAWTMLVGPEGARINVERTAAIPVDDMVQLVQTIGLGTALQLGGAVLLHACAIAVDAGALLVIGPSGTGKSTTAAAFVEAGHPLLSDDIAVLEIIADQLVVHPGLTQLRVGPETADAVGWDLHLLPRVFATEILNDKRHFELSQVAGTFCAEPRRITAVHVLQPRRAEQAVTTRPEITVVAPGEALPILLANCYRSVLLDHARRAAQLPLLARLARDVPVRLVTAADDLAALPQLVEALR